MLRGASNRASPRGSSSQRKCGPEAHLKFLSTISRLQSLRESLRPRQMSTGKYAKPTPNLFSLRARN
jgi:hypothetical protein